MILFSSIDILPRTSYTIIRKAEETMGDVIKTRSAKSGLYPYSTQAILKNLLNISEARFIMPTSPNANTTSPFSQLSREDKKLLNEYLGIVDTFSAIQEIEQISSGERTISGILQQKNISMTFDGDSVNNDDENLFKKFPILLRNKFAHLGFGLSYDINSSTHHVQGRIDNDNYFSFEVGEIAELHRFITIDIDAFGSEPYKQRDEISMLLLSTFLSDLCSMILDVLHEIVGREFVENKNIKIFNKNNIEKIIKDDALCKLIQSFIENGKCIKPQSSNNEIELLFDALKKIRNAVIHNGIESDGNNYKLSDENEHVATLSLNDIFALIKAIISSSIIDKNIKIVKLTVPNQNIDMQQIKSSNEVQELIREKAGPKIKEKIDELAAKQKEIIQANREDLIMKIENGDESVL